MTGDAKKTKRAVGARAHCRGGAGRGGGGLHWDGGRWGLKPQGPWRRPNPTQDDAKQSSTLQDPGSFKAEAIGEMDESNDD